jgi:predicted  nucleic acid-binding Zn-ribbon protein
MPHQCVRCSEFYDDGAGELLKGCPCGAKLFFYIKKEKLEKAKEFLPKDLPQKEREQIEEDVLKLVGQDNKDTPVVLDFESIRVLEPGKYEIDLIKLFKGAPLVFKLDEGKYIIDLAESFNKLKK